MDLQQTVYLFDTNKIWASQPDIEREESDKFNDVDRMIYDQKIFGGVFEYELDVDDYRVRLEDEEILKTDRDFFQHFRGCKSSFLKLSEKVNITKGLMEKTYSQARAMEAMMRHAIVHYE